MLSKSFPCEQATPWTILCKKTPTLHGKYPHSGQQSSRIPFPHYLPSGVNHSELVKAAEKAFRMLPVSLNLIPSVRGMEWNVGALTLVSHETQVCVDCLKFR